MGYDPNEKRDEQGQWTAGGDLTSAPGFKPWFGDSKIVDEHGRPLVVYHGTSGDFTSFATDKPGNFQDVNVPQDGIWFASDPQRAEWYASKAGKTPSIMPVYLSLQNPYVHSAESYADEGISSVPDLYDLKKQGYDGAIIQLAEWDWSKPDVPLKNLGTYYVAFDPTQVKSATGNNGAFSRTDERIDHAKFNPSERRDSGGKWTAGVDQTSTPAFKEWFGDSKAIDEQGRPLRVFHGTHAEFTSFDKTSIGEFGPAIYFSSNADDAATYASGRGREGHANIMPVYLSLQNPLMVTDPAQFWDKFPASSDEASIEAAKAAGYDGIIFKRPPPSEFMLKAATPELRAVLMQPTTHYMVFDKGSIKSASGNNGQFSRTDSRIDHARYSLAECLRYGRQMGLWDGSLEPRDSDGKWTTGGSGGQTATSSEERPAEDPAETYKRMGVRAPKFKDWFGDWEFAPEDASKVVDADGAPQAQHSLVEKDGVPVRVYHGTKTGGFDAFDRSKVKKASELLYGGGFYFTEDPEVAGEYAGKSTHSASGPFATREAAEADMLKYGKEHLAAFAPYGVDAKLRVHKPPNEQWYVVVDSYQRPEQSLDRELTGKDVDALVQMAIEADDAILAGKDPSKDRLEEDSRRATLKLIIDNEGGKGYRAAQFLANPANWTGSASLDWGKAMAAKMRDAIGVQLTKQAPYEVKPVYLNIRKPFDIDAKHSGALFAKALMDYVNPDGTKTEFSEPDKDWGYVEDTVRAARKAFRNDKPGAKFKGEDVYDAIAKVVGKDGAEKVLRSMGFDGITHIGGRRVGDHDHRVWIAFEPNQIKSVGNDGNFSRTDNRLDHARPDEPVRYRFDPSQKRDEQGRWTTESANFRKWFDGSKAVDADGKPKRFFHGTNAAFDTFATGGGKEGVVLGYGAYFTDDPDRARTYAGKETGAAIMPVYLSVQHPFEMSGQLTTEESLRLGRVFAAQTPGRSLLASPEAEFSSTDATAARKFWEDKLAEWEEIGDGIERTKPYVERRPAGKNPLPTFTIKYRDSSRVEMPRDAAEAFRNIYAAHGPGCSAILRAAGFDALHRDDEWVVFDAGAIKSASGNDGSFNRAVGNINHRQPGDPERYGQQGQLWAETEPRDADGKWTAGGQTAEGPAALKIKKPSSRADKESVRLLHEYVDRAQKMGVNVSAPVELETKVVGRAGQFFYDDNRITINQNFIQQYNTPELKDGEMPGWTSVSRYEHPESVLIHECGHAAHAAALKEALGEERASKYFAGWHRIVRGAGIATIDGTKVGGLGFKKVAKQVSDYAAASPLEFVAEVYTGRKYGKKYSNIVNGLYQALGGQE